MPARAASAAVVVIVSRKATGRTFMSIGLCPDLLRRLDRQVQRHTISRAEIVRRALADFLNQLEDDDDRLDDEILAQREIDRRVVRAS